MRSNSHINLLCSSTNLCLDLLIGEMMSAHNADDSSHYGKDNDVRKKDEVVSQTTNEVEAIWLQPMHKDTTFVVTKSMLQLIKSGGLFRGFEHEDYSDHLHKFVSVCNPFSADRI